MPKTTEYDFIIPLGSVCTTAHNLRTNKLQRESLPFDWIWISGLPMVCDFFAANFKNFMLKENLQFLRNNGDADIYRDNLTKTEFWHDFMAGRDFDKSYEQNVQKYQRRIQRMYAHIERSQKVLWVRVVKIFPDKQKTADDFMFENMLPTPEQTIKEFAELQKFYPHKQFELLLFYLHNKPCERREYDISPQIHICEMYNDEKYGWQGDMQAFADVLQKYDLTPAAKFRYAVNTLKFKGRRLLLQIAGICGSKSCKQRLKQRD